MVIHFLKRKTTRSIHVSTRLLQHTAQIKGEQGTDRTQTRVNHQHRKLRYGVEAGRERSNDAGGVGNGLGGGADGVEEMTKCGGC
jgi:hypothetical protein